MAAADPVDLPRIRAAHDPQQQVVAIRRSGREVLGQEICSL
jgi:hypothetical protein